MERKIRGIVQKIAFLASQFSGSEKTCKGCAKLTKYPLCTKSNNRFTLSFAQFLVRFCAEIETREPNFSELTYFIQIHIYKYAFVTIANMYLSYLQICFCHICKHVFVIFANMFAQEEDIKGWVECKAEQLGAQMQPL